MSVGCGRRECAWCGKDLGPAPGINEGEVTHGICTVCVAKEMGALSLLPTTKFDEVKCVHGIPGTEFCTGCEAEV